MNTYAIQFNGKPRPVFVDGLGGNGGGAVPLDSMILSYHENTRCELIDELDAQAAIQKLRNNKKDYYITIKNINLV